MAQDQLDLTPQDTLALSAAMRRPLTRSVHPHPGHRRSRGNADPLPAAGAGGAAADGYRLLRLADSLSTVECYELPPNAAVFPLWAAAAGVPGEHPAAAGRQWPYPVLRSPGGE